MALIERAVWFECVYAMRTGLVTPNEARQAANSNLSSRYLDLYYYHWIKLVILMMSICI